MYDVPCRDARAANQPEDFTYQTVLKKARARDLGDFFPISPDKHPKKKVVVGYLLFMEPTANRSVSEKKGKLHAEH